MTINNLAKMGTISLFALFSASLHASTDRDNPENWYDMSDPSAVYSGVSISGGNEGVNLAVNYGGYLNGQFKQQFTVQAINDLDYYTVDYMVVNANTNAGFTVESAWDKDLWGIDGFNDTSVGVLVKIPLSEKELYFYPKMNLGLMWGDDVKSTTYIKIDATTRYNFTRTLWVGITPSYTYSMQGIDLRKFQARLDAGIQLSPEFSFAGHVNNDEEFWFDIIFTF